MGKKRRTQQKDIYGEQEAITIQVAITRLKKRKAVLNTSFARTKRQLIHLFGEDELPS